MTVSRRRFLGDLGQGLALLPLVGCMSSQQADSDPLGDASLDGTGARNDASPSTGVEAGWPDAGSHTPDAGSPDSGVGLAGSATVAFVHGVASGDPTMTSVLLWTRLTPLDQVDLGAPLSTRVKLARDAELQDLLVDQIVVTTADDDYTVHLSCEDLSPGSEYYYRFEDVANPSIVSTVGRTRTLPSSTQTGLRIAIVSCSNLFAGHFNTYADLAGRDDIDVVVHLGDYIYEYAETNKVDPATGEPAEPAREIVSLSDYRARHAQYKRNRALQALHARHPTILVWDDHEIANNTFIDGAENHQPATEGDFAQRKAAAMRAYLEWTPLRLPDPDAPTRIYRSFTVGDLCDLVVIDTRTLRNAQDIGAVADPSRSILGEAQAVWLEQELARSQERGAHFRVMLGQVLMLSLAELTTRNADTWDGYRASRDRLLTFVRERGVEDLMVVSGDWHSSWAGELALDPFSSDADASRPLAVELHCPAVTSKLPAGLAAFYGNAMARAPHPHIHWTDLEHNGYVTLDISTTSIRVEYWFSRTVVTADDTHELARVFSLVKGSAKLTKLV